MKEYKNEENENNPKGTIIILGIYIHCQGCKDQVLKSLRGFDGIGCLIFCVFQLIYQIFAISNQYNY